jgi:hypothetical protein
MKTDEEYAEDDRLFLGDEEPTTEFEKALKMYDDHFEGTFPTIPLCWGRSEEEVIDIIQQCLAEDKDVYEMGVLPEPSFDIIY